MDAQALISDLASRDIRLILDGDSLIAQPASKLTDADRDTIRTHKTTLLAHLRVAQYRPAAEALERNQWPEPGHPRMPLRRCGALVCRTCHVHRPSPHREGCAFPRFEHCGSRWFWLSRHGAIKCVACAAPADLALVEAWVLAREDDPGYRIPPEILSLLHITTPIQ